MSKCLQCYGSKTMMGGGFMTRECDACNGTGYNIEGDAETKSIDAIQAADKTLTKSEAKRIFNQEFEKSKKKNKR